MAYDNPDRFRPRASRRDPLFGVKRKGAKVVVKKKNLKRKDVKK